MRIRLAFIMLVGLALGAIGASWLLNSQKQGGTPTISFGKAAVGGPFTLTDHNGRRVTDKDFRGKYMLIYFGFTFCPDICPGSLQVMTAALEKLGPKADRVVPLLISVDPDRDTPAQLKLYVENFDRRLIGLTGTPEEIAAVAKAYRVYYAKTKDPKSSAPYTVDHVSMFYLMDPKGEFSTFFRHGVTADAMAEQLAKLL
jgi:protein SCO1/2